MKDSIVSDDPVTVKLCRNFTWLVDASSLYSAHVNSSHRVNSLRSIALQQDCLTAKELNL